jgi:cell division septum initiation protein DivIVA
VRFRWRRELTDLAVLRTKIAELGRRAAVLDELAAAERQNAATQAENLRLLKALTAAEERADQWMVEATAARVELAARIESDRYANKLCPGCGQAADDDMNGPDGHVLADDPTRQEPNE